MQEEKESIESIEKDLNARLEAEGYVPGDEVPISKLRDIIKDELMHLWSKEEVENV